MAGLGAPEVLILLVIALIAVVPVLVIVWLVRRTRGPAPQPWAQAPPGADQRPPPPASDPPAQP